MEGTTRSHQRFHRLRDTAAVVLFGFLSSTEAQHQPTASMEISHVELVNEAVSIDYEVCAFEKSLFVGACKGVEGRKNLCDLSLEVHFQHGWKAVKGQHCGCKLGFPFPETWDIQSIPAGQKGRFLFRLSKLSFAINRGQSLRLVAHAWTDEQTLRNQKDGITLTSEPFECP